MDDLAIEMKKWRSIESFAHVIRGFERYKNKYEVPLVDPLATVGMLGAEHSGHWVKYGRKIKLHGTNAWIHRDSNGTWVAGKRSGTIDYPSEDNAGFASWFFGTIRPNLDQVFSQDLLNYDGALTIYGEWSGPGVQKGVASSSAPRKFFSVFSVVKTHEGMPVEIHDPAAYASDMTQNESLGFYVLPWHRTMDASEHILVNFDDAKSIQNFIDLVNREVEEIEKEDPWVKSTFGVSGVGEGLVFYPVAQNFGFRLGDLMFKAKGEEHRVTQTPAAISRDLVKSSNARNLAEKLCTEARLKQIYSETFGDEIAPPAKIPTFLSAVAADIVKECSAEIAESGFEWKKDMAGPVAKLARDHHMNKFNEVTR